MENKKDVTTVEDVKNAADDLTTAVEDVTSELVEEVKSSEVFDG